MVGPVEMNADNRGDPPPIPNEAIGSKRILNKAATTKL